MAKLNDQLRDVSIFVLQEFAMTLVDIPKSFEEGIDTEGEFYIVSASFEEAEIGKIFVACQDGFVSLIASRLLGKPADELKTSEKIDALSELTNHISGHFTSRAFGTDKKFSFPDFVFFSSDYSGFQKIFNSKSSHRIKADDTDLFVGLDQN